MKKFLNYIFTALGGLIILTIIGGLIYFEYNIWTECRQTNSFFYCLRVMSR